MGNLTFLFTFLVITTASISAVSQDTISIQVEGKVSYEIPHEAIYLEINFSENGVSCGPNTQFETVYDQVDNFYSQVKNIGLTTSFEEVNVFKNSISGKNKVTLKTKFTDIESAKKIQEAAAFAFADKVNYFYLYPEKKFEDEDEKAILALRDAKSKALKIKSVLNKEHIKLISIDDEITPTMRPSQYFPPAYRQVHHSIKANKRSYRLLVNYILY